MPVKGGIKGDDIGKIFVGGLAPATDKDKMQAYFEKFGPIVDCVLMTDQNTKVSRRFGFVTFRDPETVQKVVNEKEHFLDGKKIDPKPAVPRGSGQSMSMTQMKVNNNDLKIFIGGIAHNTTEEDIEQYFCQFTKCKGVQLVVDKNNGKPRGFGFVTFETKEDVDKAVEAHFHQINGKMVEVKRAEYKTNQGKSPFGGQSNPLATPPVHSMQGAMGRGQYGQQGYMQGAYGQQAGGMQGLGRGGYNAAYGGYAAVGAAGGFGYGAPQPQGYGAGGMPMGGAAPGAGGYSQGGYGANPQMSGYAVGAGREPAAPGYGAPGYGAGGYPAPGAMAPGAPPGGAPDYGQGMPASSSPLSGPGAGMPPHGEVSGGGDYTGSYSAYGLGNYQQQDSQYGPARGSFGGESGYSAYPTGDSYGSGGSGGGYSGGSGGESFGRGGGGATRGFHPYVR